MTVALSSPETIDLTSEEVLLLRFTCDLHFDEESAFGAAMARGDQEALGQSARSLVEKGLADRRTYRPHRELLRRLLILAQPDCRIILLSTIPGRSERLLDVYGRAGAYVAYARAGSEHRLGPPLELIDVFDDVLSHFTPRTASGDFIDLRLTASEYFAFSAATTEERLDSDHPLSRRSESTLDGIIVTPPKGSRFAVADDPLHLLAIPEEEEWRSALRGLRQKGAMAKNRGEYELRGYLRDLAFGLAHRRRHVLTRIELGGDGSVRDSTLVHVPGSLFWLRPTQDGGLSIREVDPDVLKRAIRSTIEEVSRGSRSAAG